MPVELDLFEAGRPTICARVNRVNNGLLELCSPAYVRPRQHIEMRHPDRSIECQVAYCKGQPDGGYRLGLVIAGDGERRSEPRTAVALTGLLRVSGSFLKMAVGVTDVSRCGLGLDLPAAISPGASVSVELSAGTAAGEIRHCTRYLDRYRAGMRMDEFIVHTHGRELIAWNGTGPAICRPIATLARSVQERQSRYEAVLFSLAPAAGIATR